MPVKTHTTAHPRRGQAIALCAAVLVILGVPRAEAQELTPGAYWPLPPGINIITAVNSFSWGDVAFEPSVPVEEASARINSTVAAYTRTIAIAGRSANVGFQLPVVGGHLEGLYLGEYAERDRFGLGDPRVQVGVNLYGAPAMSPSAFAKAPWRTLVGVSVTTIAPLGQYDPTKVINLGTNRWSLKPELGFARANGKWIMELMAGVWLFTDNTEFLGSGTREQNPIGSAQVHLTYRFSPRMWLAADANFYAGGRTTVNGKQNVDLQRNSRVGSTFSRAFDRHHSVRASVSRGAYTTIGADFTSVAFGYNYAWSR